MKEMERPDLTTRVRQIAQRVADVRSLELVNVEIAGTKRDSVLRIYIDKPEGVTLDDCSLFSRDVEEVLDLEDFIPSRYVLEVSSPGIERQLYSVEDFRRFAGRLVKIKTREEINGQKLFVGVISDIDEEGQITIEDRSGPVTLGFPDIAKANLKIDLSKEFGR